MKRITREDLEKSQIELKKAVKEEEVSLRKLGIAVSLGREKKTHLVRQARRKIAVFKTLLSQKEFLGEVAK